MAIKSIFCKCLLQMYALYKISRFTSVKAFSTKNAKVKVPLIQQLSSFLNEKTFSKVQQSFQLSSNEIQATPFLNPLQLEKVLNTFTNVPNLKLIQCGGFTDSFKKRLIFLNQSLVGTEVDCNEFVKAVRIKSKHELESLNYKDLLSHFETACSIDLTEIGDVVVWGNNQVDIVCTKDILPIILSTNQISQIPVIVQEISNTELVNKIMKTKDITSVEASLRLDAILSAGMGLSRSKAMGLIDSGMVQLNWNEISKACSVQEGSVIWVPGVGKLEVLTTEQTNKGRWRVQMKKFYN